MTLKPWRAIAFCCLLISGLQMPSAQVHAQTSKAGSCTKRPLPQLQTQLKTIVDTPNAELAGLSVVVIKQGCVVFESHQGYRRIDLNDVAHSLPMTSDTKVRIASVSKLITAILVMQQVERGRMSLDTDVSRYLGFTLRNPAHANTPITLRMLLSHTSSLLDGDGYSFPISTRLADVFKPEMNKTPRWDVAHAPGTFFSYQNFNYGVAATALEAVMKQRFDVIAREQLIKPLGLNASYNVQDFADADFDNIATLYRKRNEKEVWNSAGPWFAQFDDFKGKRPTPLHAADALQRYTLGTNATLFSPQGGLRISALDLAKLMQVLMNNGRTNDNRDKQNVQLLKPARLKQMFAPAWTYNAAQKNGDTEDGFYKSFSMGAQRFARSEFVKGTNENWAGHFGEAYGVLSGFVFDPVKREGIIYLINGVGADTDKTKGTYSSRTLWEEQILTASYEHALRRPSRIAQVK